MQRKVYIWVSALLALAGIFLALHVLRVDDSLPPVVKLYGRGWFVHSLSRDFFVRAILVDAFLLPVTCWLFALVAHAGRQEIDIFSWLFVAAFYLAFWWLGFEVDHVNEINNRQIVVRGIINPLELLALAVATGLGFWKWKQETKLS